MKVVSVRDFKNQATKLLREEIEKGNSIILTKRRKPVALVKPYENESREAIVGYLIGEMDKIFKEAHISKEEALRALDQARKEIYGT
jgi:antitoxin (DNA-binding transcriptional repressor) of toxin-antitoxin stability system